ncbi:MAG: hypothetical protein KJO52_06425 [Maribacter sp.]|nr:hypothetical protein [Maribacter sp.]MBT8300636.1 hypothetical protein [Maribacter sp.]NNK19092.1 hypothetical protein [Maribacter sp.]
MIKFFRHIRYTLMEQNKTSKYLKYAIGEIILVVIGILIALQINNWNQDRINANEELSILKSLKAGLKKDQADILYNKSYFIESIADADKVIEALENDLPYNDSIPVYIGRMMRPMKFLHSTSAFETLKSKGIGFIRNTELRDEIIHVFDSRYTFFLGEENRHLDELYRGLEEIFPTRIEESYVFDLNAKGLDPILVPINYEALKTDQEFLYYIKSFKNRIIVMTDYHYKLMNNIVVNLMNSIDKEINHLEN